DVDRDWVPNGPDSAYYLRPLVFATEERMGLKSSDEFLFMVMGGPFRPLFAKPLRVKVEREYSRAAPGGTGFAKCAGNYAAAMYPTQMAKEQGFDQVLWTDAFTHQHIEESGAMNVAFVIDDVVVTPPLSDTILDGVTRASVLELARELGYAVEERTVDVAELADGIEGGSVTEAFGVGTAASIAPIETISIDGVDHTLKIDESAKMFELRRRLNAIRFGETTDTHSWMTTI
ncbi:MAG: branched chain amino acid aminotransferase, partial [Ignavibacteriae bacterium]